MNKLISVDYDNTPFRPQIIQTELFYDLWQEDYFCILRFH